MKILLDEDTGKVFAQRLTELLEPEGATVFRSVKVGWRGAKNGDLLTMAANKRLHALGHRGQDDG